MALASGSSQTKLTKPQINYIFKICNLSQLSDKYNRTRNTIGQNESVNDEPIWVTPSFDFEKMTWRVGLGYSHHYCRYTSCWQVSLNIIVANSVTEETEFDSESYQFSCQLKLLSQCSEEKSVEELSVNVGNETFAYLDDWTLMANICLEDIAKLNSRLISEDSILLQLTLINVLAKNN